MSEGVQCIYKCPRCNGHQIDVGDIDPWTCKTCGAVYELPKVRSEETKGTEPWTIPDPDHLDDALKFLWTCLGALAEHDGKTEPDALESMCFQKVERLARLAASVLEDYEGFQDSADAGYDELGKHIEHLVQGYTNAEYDS